MIPDRIAILGPVVLATLALRLTGCKEERSEAKPEVPAYARPSYVMPENTDAASTIRFSDVTTEAGIDFVHVTGAFGEKWMPETMGSGGGFFDYNGDGWADVLLVNGGPWPGHEAERPPPTLKLYRNRGDGTFEDVTAPTGLALTIYGMGCTMADYDGDGDVDVYVTAVGPNRLLRNDDGRFVDVTSAAGVIGHVPGPGAVPAWSVSAAWFDADRDGWLDLLVANYVKWSPETDIYTTLDGVNKSYATPQPYPGQSCRLYRNLGEGTFADVTKRAGLFNDEGKSLGVALDDFNGDGALDVVISNDTEPNFLYFNDGAGHFAEIGVEAGVAYDENGRARAGMGVDVADINNNGKLAIGIGNFSREPLALFTQLDDRFFQDRAGRARLTRSTLLPLTFGVLFEDFDLDGRVDLVTANGHVEPRINGVQRDVTFAQRMQLFRNNGQGQFVDVSDDAGKPFAEPMVGRGLASADIDGDGDLDLLVTVNGGRARLLRNDLDRNANWVSIRLRGTGANPAAIGAALVARCGTTTQRRLVRTGSSYLSQSDTNVIFGLGSDTQIDELDVRWPSGRRDTFTALAARRAYVIEEGSTNPTVLQRAAAVSDGTSIAPPGFVVP